MKLQPLYILLQAAAVLFRAVQAQDDGGMCAGGDEASEARIVESGEDDINGTMLMDKDAEFPVDPEMLKTLTLLVYVPPEDRESAVQKVMESVGDDPKQLEDLDLVLKMLPKLDEWKDNLWQLIQDALFMHEQWKMFWSKQAQILEETIAKGQWTTDQIALFKSDENAWKKELKNMYDQITNLG